MSLVSNVYSNDKPIRPINKQAATGCREMGSRYDDKPFHPLAGKGCLKWVLENCRETDNPKDLIYKIAAGCNVPVLEVMPMVEDWIKSRRAIWQDGKFVVRKHKPKGLSESEKTDLAYYLAARAKVANIRDALEGKVTYVPEFYAVDLGNYDYDVAVQVDGELMLLTDWIYSISGVALTFKDNAVFVAGLVLMLRGAFEKFVVNHEAKESCGVDGFYKRSMEGIKALIKPMKSNQRHRKLW